MKRTPAGFLSHSRTAAIVLGGALTAAGVQAWRTVWLSPPPAAERSASPPPLIAPASLGDSALRGEVRRTARELDNDPFAPDRQLPGRAVAAAPRAAPVEMFPRQIPPAAVRLLGTVLLPDGGGFAVYQLPSDVPRTVYVGAAVGGLTLIEVAPGRAVFRASDGERIELHLPKAGS